MDRQNTSKKQFLGELLVLLSIANGILSGVGMAFLTSYSLPFYPWWFIVLISMVYGATNCFVFLKALPIAILEKQRRTMRY